MKKVLKFIGYFVGILVLLVLMMKVFFPVYNVKSMTSTEEKGKDYNYNYVVVSRFYYSLFDKKTGDTIAFKPTKGVFNNVWIFKVGVIGSDVTIYSKIIDEIKKQLSDGYKPIFIDGFNSRTGIVANEKIIGKVIFSF